MHTHAFSFVYVSSFCFNPDYQPPSPHSHSLLSPGSLSSAANTATAFTRLHSLKQKQVVISAVVPSCMSTRYTSSSHGYRITSRNFSSNKHLKLHCSIRTSTFAFNIVPSVSALKNEGRSQMFLKSMRATLDFQGRSVR